ncbi:MAG: CopG family transcriptional regulator [Ignavibacteria bacterium]|nr:CopG family transcriptional regulator [Ignavibacteria bacterium]
MATLSKRTTVYLDPQLHKVLKLKAAETSVSISQIIDEALRKELAEDEEDLKVFQDRAKEPTVSYEKLLAELKRDGRI